MLAASKSKQGGAHEEDDVDIILSYFPVIRTYNELTDFVYGNRIVEINFMCEFIDKDINTINNPNFLFLYEEFVLHTKNKTIIDGFIIHIISAIKILCEVLNTLRGRLPDDSVIFFLYGNYLSLNSKKYQFGEEMRIKIDQIQAVVTDIYQSGSYPCVNKQNDQCECVRYVERGNGIDCLKKIEVDDNRYCVKESTLSVKNILYTPAMYGFCY